MVREKESIYGSQYGYQRLYIELETKPQYVIYHLNLSSFLL